MPRGFLAFFNIPCVYAAVKSVLNYVFAARGIMQVRSGLILAVNHRNGKVIFDVVRDQRKFQVAIIDRYRSAYGINDYIFLFNKG